MQAENDEKQPGSAMKTWRNRPKTAVLGIGCTQVLFLVMNGHDRGRAWTLKEMSVECKVCVNAIIGFLDRLEKLGLIRRERFKCRTIWPTCRFIPAEELP